MLRRHRMLLCCAVVSALASRADANETATSSDAFFDTMGINIHAGHYLGYGGVAYINWDGIINAVGDIGFRYVRDHSLEYQRLNQLSAATGAKVIAISESQDSSSGVLKLNQAELPNVMARTKALTGLAYIEGPNEYDGYPDPNWFNDLLQWQSGIYAVAKNDPALASKPVIAPSLAGQPSYSVFAPYCDVQNMHSYPAGGLWDNYLEGHIIQAGYVAGTNKPLFATETGYTTAYQSTANDFAVNEAAQAKYIPRLYMEYYNRGVRMTVPYVLALWQNVLVYDNANRVDINNPAVAVTVNLNVPMEMSTLYGLNSAGAL